MATRLHLLTLLLAAATTAAVGAAPAADMLFITTEHSPPASMLDGDTVVGRETEKIREMLVRSEIPHQISLLPWKRAYMLAQQQERNCVYSTTRTPEREKLFKWVGPTYETEWLLLGRADRKLTLRTLDDARPLRIGTYLGDARDEYLRERGFLVEPAQNDASNPKKLLLNRIDLWAVGMRTGSQSLQQFKLPPEIVPLLTFNHVQVYLACNLNVPDALIARMNAALATMRRDGSLARVERKYANWSEQK